MSETKLAGTLAQTPLHQVLKWVWENHFSGALVLAHDEIKKTVLFENGKPVSARSNILEESMGAILIEEGRITNTQLQKSLQVSQENEGMRQGEVLLSMKLLDPAMLNDVLCRQFSRRLFEIFLWQDGKYALVDQQAPETAKIQVPETLPELCLRGLIEKYKKNNATSTLSLEMKPIVSGSSTLQIDQLKLVGREMGFYRAINGVSTVAELLQKSKIEETAGKALLFSLRDMELIRLGNEVVMHGTHQVEKVFKPTKNIKPSNEVMAEILKRVDAAEKQNFFEILGINQKSTDVEIKKAYFELAKAYHPDRIPTGVTTEEKKLAEGYFAIVTEAHATIGNSKTRKEYEASLEVEASGVDTQQINEIIESEMEFQKGRVLVKKGDFPGAVEYLERAVKLYSKEPEYFIYLGWAQFRSGRQKNNSALERKAKENISKAIKERPNIGEGYYYLGMIEKTEGNNDKAKNYFQKTIEVMPNHPEANSELRIMNMRSEKKPSGIMGVFGKKK